MKERIYRIHKGIPHTVAILSDLHNKNGRAAAESLRQRRPDLIAVTGDLFLGYRAIEGEDLLRTQENVLPLIRQCAQLAPTYLSLGNHEWAVSTSDLQALRDNGAVVLDNTWTRDASTGLLLGGLTSAKVSDFRQFRKKHDADIPYTHEKRHADTLIVHPSAKWLKDFERQDGFKILLCHHPEYWSLQKPFLKDHPIDLVLAGHAHGGQIRLFGRGLFAPGQGALPRYSGGMHHGPHGQLIISRGLANTAPPPIPRLFNPREIVYIDLR